MFLPSRGPFQFAPVNLQERENGLSFGCRVPGGFPGIEAAKHVVNFLEAHIHHLIPHRRAVFSVRVVEEIGLIPVLHLQGRITG